MITPFSFARIPHIIFGVEKLKELSEVISKFGKNVLLVTGSGSLKSSGKLDEIVTAMGKNSISHSLITIEREPSPLIVDKHAREFSDKKIEVVIGIGGGSVIDAAKAISAMIPKVESVESVKEYLEGVGTKIHDGEKVPFIAIPTTSGTGSEATKNAVLSEVSPNGFKKSLRHDNLVPDVAIIDPELMISCPPSITAACGMDAFTQLLEAYVSTKGNPMTDALAISGLNRVKDALVPSCSSGMSDILFRTKLAYGALISGVVLANAGLGIVHGLASPIGGFFNVPHGVACGTLLSEATKMNIELLKEKGPAGKPVLKKHALVGALLVGKKSVENGKTLEYCKVLTDTLDYWTEELKMNPLSKYGISEKDLDKIIEKTGLKNNPVKLSKENIRKILLNRL